MGEKGKQNKANWWCIRFDQSEIDSTTLKKINLFFKKLTPHVVHGKDRVFLDVSQSKTRVSLDAFQNKLALVANKLDANLESWQWGFGRTLVEAWVQSRWKTLSPDLLPLEAILDYHDPLELNRKSREENRSLQVLRSYGVNSLQDLIEMPEDELLSQGGIWISEVCRENFSRPNEWREEWLERATVDSLTHGSSLSFQLDDWIPSEYLNVG